MTTRKLAYYFILICFIVIVVECGSLIAARFLHKKGLIYIAHVGSNYEDYLKKRDQRLGWPAPDTFGKDGKRDKTGSRIIPLFPDPDANPSCVSLFGDSFTWSDEVNNEDAWSNVLSKLLNCRVANYGVPGYGTDQAFLRFMQYTEDNSKIVILGHVSENILRNVNQFRDLLYPELGYGFKPRFILDNNKQLLLMPLPYFTPNEYQDVVKNPARYLQHEYFIPNGQSGLRQLSFPYTLSVMLSLSHFHFAAKLKGLPWYYDFYNNNHLSQALPITTEIIKNFYLEAQKKGKIPIIAIIPTGKDLLYYQTHNAWTYQNLITSLNQINYNWVNIGEQMIKHINGGDPCKLFHDCTAHYNKEGYAMLAAIMFDYLSSHIAVNAQGERLLNIYE
jgi:hypothetical protein